MSAFPRLAIAGVVVAFSCVSHVPIRASPAESLPSTGVEPSHVIETLKVRLLSAHSATAVLEAWCAERGLADDPSLTAERMPGPDKPLSPEQRLRLRIGIDESVRYRRVRLACGTFVLSEADNWYVPARLTPEMNRVLDTTRTPFGRVVHPLMPSRRNLSIAQIWTQTAAPPLLNEPIFAITAVLSTGDGVPFCEVAETYTGAVIARAQR